MLNQGRTKVNNFWIVLVILVVLCSSLVLSTLAWLKETYNYSDDKSKIGVVDVSLYADGEKVTGTTSESGGVTTWTGNLPYLVSGGTLSRSLNLKARNEGTISALVRVTISVYCMENNNKRVALLNDNPNSFGQLKLTTTNWVTQFPESVVACGYMFYATPLEPFTQQYVDDEGNINSTTNSDGEVSIIDSINLSELDKDTDYYVDVCIDAVAYAGNIYGKIQKNETSLSDIPISAYPFGKPENLPTNWTAYILN